MFYAVSIWLAVIAFFGAGLVNAIGLPATQETFVRWGYPRWWCRVTGGSEMAVAILIAFPATRGMGLIFGAVIIAAAVLTALRHREFAHLAPLALFATLLMLTEAASSTSGSFPAL
ncbi:DoxX family protein [Sphingomonas asaccharolytica]|uniref:DoxX family protein n=1 Tax=Sphingomonas asaccharolytica TaxID=40681 RepID=UPI00082E14DE|nr:DoxX family protein [Sphingomonas asaccharolytica]